jgi:hypothetical protein
MIDEEATLEEHNNIVSEISLGSHKLVVRVCDGCGIRRQRLAGSTKHLVNTLIKPIYHITGNNK